MRMWIRRRSYTSSIYLGLSPSLTLRSSLDNAELSLMLRFFFFFCSFLFCANNVYVFWWICVGICVCTFIDYKAEKWKEQRICLCDYGFTRWSSSCYSQIWLSSRFSSTYFCSFSFAYLPKWILILFFLFFFLKLYSTNNLFGLVLKLCSSISISLLVYIIIFKIYLENPREFFLSWYL